MVEEEEREVVEEVEGRIAVGVDSSVTIVTGEGPRKANLLLTEVGVATFSSSCYRTNHKR